MTIETAIAIAIDDYSAELEAQDPYFTRKEQAELRRRIEAVEAGEYVEYE